jgi:hypothetical protein
MAIPKVIAIWLELPERVPASRFIPIKSLAELEPKVVADSQMWADRFYAAESNPHAAKDVRYSFNLSDGEKTADLLRYEWTIAGLDLEGFETRGFTLVRIRKHYPLPLAPADADAIAKRVLNMSDGQHTWKVKYPAGPLNDGTWFSTHPDADPFTTNSWKDRLDVAIRGGFLEFLCFKKHEQTVGLTGADYWFSDEFRAAHHGRPRQ